MALKNTKAKGNRNERRTMRYLEKKGYYTSRSAASLGIFDVIAIPKEEGCTRLIQVKTNRMPAKAEVEGIKNFATPYYIAKELWIWKDYEKKPTIIDLSDDGSSGKCTKCRRSNVA